MTPLERYDLARDHLTKALATINDSTVTDPEISHHSRLLADRLRELLSTQLRLAQRLLDDHAQITGLFDDPPAMPNSGQQGGAS